MTKASRYVLCRADLSGTEADVEAFDRLDAALAVRDHFRNQPDRHHVYFRIIDREDPERGDLDWDSMETGP